MPEENPPHRPPLYDAPMHKVNVHLTERHRHLARQLGEGNMSEGIRRALERYAEEE